MRFRGSIARSPECALKRSIAIFAILPAAVLLDAHPASARQVEEPHWHDNAPRFPGPPRAEEGSDAVPRRARIMRRHAPSRRAARGVPATRGAKRPAHRQRTGMRMGGRHPVALAVRPARTTRHAGTRVERTVTPQPPPSLDQRSVLAAHPLLLDPPGEVQTAFAPSEFTFGMPRPAPRCRSAQPGSIALAVAGLGAGTGPSEPAMVEGAWPHCRPARAPQSKPEPPRVRLASLGPAPRAPSPAERQPLSAAGGSIRWIASPRCLTGSLRSVLAQVASNFGPLTVNSTCRSLRHNRRVGGAPRSYHLTGNAVDFRVSGSYGRVLAFLSRLRGVGGLKHYGRGVFHIDTGPRRTWGARRYARR